MTDHEEIKQLEEALRLAMLTSNITRLDELLADDLIFTNHLGQLLTKEMDLDTHRSGSLVINQLVPDEQQIKRYDDTAVVSVFMSIEGSFSGQEFSIRNRYTRVWIKRNDRWEVVAAHGVLVA